MERKQLELWSNEDKGKKIKKPGDIRQDKHAAEAFKLLTDLLEKRGVELKDHELTIRAACSAWSMIKQAEEEIRDHGVLIEGKDGLKANPACGFYASSQATFLALVKTLGVKVDRQTGGNDAADEFLKIIAG